MAARRSKLTHLDAANRPTMVDVGHKTATRREAAAEALVMLPAAVARELKRSGHRTKKGPVFDTAIIAGVLAAKRTHELIPFCHPLPLSSVKIEVAGMRGGLRITCEVGATVHRCERRPDDPPGDPSILRFREAVAAGAIPFTVQGPENAYCLDGGRTLGWEIADQAADQHVSLDRIVVQVGGGALAACVGAGLGHGVRLDTVQAAGCAPLAETWERITYVDHPERYWSQVMRPWPDPTSLADGILDDETYDWIADVEVMVESGGRPVVAPESEIVRAHELATAAGFDVSPTGSAGLAGVLAARADIHDHHRVAVIMSGAARP